MLDFLLVTFLSDDDFIAKWSDLFVNDSSIFRCPKLEVLWIKSCPNVTDASMTKIASNCPNLKELDMSYSYGISHESLVMLGRNCNNLKILKRNLYPRLDPNMPTIIAPLDYLATYPKHANVEAEVIGRHMPQLKQLEFRYTTLTAKGLALVCEGCSDLEYMDLYGCISLRSEEITRWTSSLMSLREINKPNFMFPMAILRMSRPDHPRYGWSFSFDALLSLCHVRFDSYNSLELFYSVSECVCNLKLFTLCTR